jgi:hypothetical protein
VRYVIYIYIYIYDISRLRVKQIINKLIQWPLSRISVIIKRSLVISFVLINQIKYPIYLNGKLFEKF